MRREFMLEIKRGELTAHLTKRADWHKKQSGYFAERAEKLLGLAQESVDKSKAPAALTTFLSEVVADWNSRSSTPLHSRANEAGKEAAKTIGDRARAHATIAETYDFFRSHLPAGKEAFEITIAEARNFELISDPDDVARHVHRRHEIDMGSPFVENDVKITAVIEALDKLDE